MSTRKTKKYQAAIATVARLYTLDPESFAAWAKTGRHDAIYRLLEKLQYEWTGAAWRLQEPVWIRRYKRLNPMGSTSEVASI